MRTMDLTYRSPSRVLREMQYGESKPMLLATDRRLMQSAPQKAGVCAQVVIKLDQSKDSVCVFGLAGAAFVLTRLLFGVQLLC
jgi:hypothetical protein